MRASLWELIHGPQYVEVLAPAVQCQGERPVAPGPRAFPKFHVDLFLRHHLFEDLLHLELACVHAVEQRLLVALVKPRQRPHHVKLPPGELFAFVQMAAAARFFYRSALSRSAEYCFFHCSFHLETTPAQLDLWVVDNIY